ncbi:hypothetical protein Q3G72_016123 [Acer saccharum]|nr:hypothetical protein Q3G72_016123 [Acer saccharum]
MVVSSEEESSSSSSESSRRIRYLLGECSKKVHSKEGMRPGMNRVAERPIGLPIISMDSNDKDSSFSEESGHDENGTMVPESDLDPIMEEQQGWVTQDNRFEPIYLEVDLGVVNCMEGTRVSKGGQFPHTKNRRVTRKESSVRTHGMQTRNKKIGGDKSWNLEVDMTRAIERQYSKRFGKLGDNMDTLSLEMEIAKVLEIGAALGFDFHGREEELS